MEIMSEGSVGRLLIPANYVGCLSANQMTGTFLLPAPQCTSAVHWRALAPKPKQPQQSFVGPQLCIVGHRNIALQGQR